MGTYHNSTAGHVATRDFSRPKRMAAGNTSFQTVRDVAISQRTTRDLFNLRPRTTPDRRRSSRLLGPELIHYGKTNSRVESGESEDEAQE